MSSAKSPKKRKYEVSYKTINLVRKHVMATNAAEAIDLVLNWDAGETIIDNEYLESQPDSVSARRYVKVETTRERRG